MWNYRLKGLGNVLRYYGRFTITCMKPSKHFLLHRR